MIKPSSCSLSVVGSYTTVLLFPQSSPGKCSQWYQTLKPRIFFYGLLLWIPLTIIRTTTNYTWYSRCTQWWGFWHYDYSTATTTWKVSLREFLGINVRKDARWRPIAVIKQCCWQADSQPPFLFLSPQHPCPWLYLLRVSAGGNNKQRSSQTRRHSTPLVHSSIK